MASTTKKVLIFVAVAGAVAGGIWWAWKKYGKPVTASGNNGNMKPYDKPVTRAPDIKSQATLGNPV